MEQSVGGRVGSTAEQRNADSILLDFFISLSSISVCSLMETVEQSCASTSTIIKKCIDWNVAHAPFLCNHNWKT